MYEQRANSTSGLLGGFCGSDWPFLTSLFLQGWSAELSREGAELQVSPPALFLAETICSGVAQHVKSGTCLQ